MCWEIRVLDSGADRSSFDCGVGELNEYLQKNAGQNNRLGVGKTYVAVSEEQGRKVLGFYTLSAGQINFDSCPPDIRKRLPRYPIPVLRIGRLAVDRSVQGRGLGTDLLMHAFEKAATLALEVGIFGVIVDAKDERLKQFYEKNGFVSTLDNPLTLIIPMKTILEKLKQKWQV